MVNILLDMDEVLVDFVGGALWAHGWTRRRLENVWLPGRWSIVEPMGLTQEEFTQPIFARGERFWTELELTPWAEDLIGIVSAAVGDNWTVVTSPLGHPSCYAGKYRWIRQFFGEEFDRFIFVPGFRKHLMASPETVLIDDREETVSNFVRYGGVGIVFPSRHNRLYPLAHDPVGWVRQQLSWLLEKGAGDALQVP